MNNLSGYGYMMALLAHITIPGKFQARLNCSSSCYLLLCLLCKMKVSALCERSELKYIVLDKVEYSR